MNYTVKFKNGRETIEDQDYNFDTENKSFTTSTNKYYNFNLIIDFSNYDNITFYISSNCILKCGDNCKIRCLKNNELYLGKNCLIEDYRGNNIIYSCKENCQVEIYEQSWSLYPKVINKFFIPTNYKIKTCSVYDKNNIGFEIVK